MPAKPSVYVETTIVSYLTARVSRDIVRRGHQQITRQWWNDRRPDFLLCTSQFVLDESSLGDSSAAIDRLTALKGVKLLAIQPEVPALAARLLAGRALPTKARVDALHLAVATIGGAEFLMTWNCRHLANARQWATIDHICRSEGYVPPVICTPYELLGRDA